MPFENGLPAKFHAEFRIRRKDGSERTPCPGAGA